ncbi:signal peptidase I [Parabacteroides sp. PF5-5]|uniref:signal peptidase I n=1 Tax=unclassified Parabacteroides TaxID=2649774 RepID=UPI002473B4CD|nr:MULTISPECIES: signal peptidase I [unclassified Parabacteroides]MDH6305073.1 signal peptidase I [Parabacteroides sp. PH5-39]MDH6315842.1 signal peptidase I [Parabacteroides sp. PF5-13]MDH6319499.1 signal peptidase I [Parabacteroides sp. PH5-13]MDH6323230.1 signal peptidase I [Parabacteroides sp. PH5-8]MDH6327262.1 signal peptidase I [Parabacteroides sp. PH5-41]
MYAIGKKGIIAILAIVAVVLVIRYFCIGSYRISTHSMEEALHKGDFILVNKLKKNPVRNKVLLFTSPLQQDKDKDLLIVSRCIALPGDTIRVGQEGYTINGVLHPRSPRSLATYTIAPEIKGAFTNLLKKLEIPIREQGNDKKPSFSLTPFEEYQIREEMNERVSKLFVKEKEENYTLIVPRKGQTYRLDENFLTACREAIIDETEAKVSFRNRKLYLDGKETTRFSFQRDYYWVLSDNTEDAIDSRHLGFIPAEHIVGEAWFCWYSKDKQHRFKKVN